MRIALVKSKNVALSRDEVVDGGTLRFQRDLEVLNQIGCDVDVFYGDSDEVPLGRAASATIHRIPFVPSSSSVRFERDLANGEAFTRGLISNPEFSGSRFDILWTHHWSSTVGLPRSAENFRRWIHTPHLLAHARATFESAPPAALSAELKTLDQSDLVVCLSRYEESACADLTESPTVVIPNGISSHFFDVPLSAPVSRNQRPQILTIARLVPQKGLTTLLDAVTDLKSRGAQFNLTIVGTDGGDPMYERSLKERVRHIGGSVSLQPHVSHSDLAAVFAAHPVYVQSSLLETQGMTVLEAMASGRVVVVGRGSAASEYATDRNSISFAESDPDHLAAAITMAIAESQRSASIAESARGTATQFSWTTHREATTRLVGCLDAEGNSSG